MKTKKELNALKEEVETVSKKLHELTDEELKQVVGGQYGDITKYGPDYLFDHCTEKQYKVDGH